MYPIIPGTGTMKRLPPTVLLGMKVTLVVANIFSIFRFRILGGASLSWSDGGWQQEVSTRDEVSILCPSALKLFDNATELSTAIADNIQFHQHGGNLDAIEKYLNSHMQDTLNHLDVQFTPNGKEDNGPSDNAIQHLQDYYSKNAVKRGGYGQPLPGSLSSKHGMPIINKALFEKRWINVIEPPKFERFTVGIGRVGPACSHKVKFSEGTYEEKRLCVAAATEDATRSEEEEECNIISIGSNDEWGFETEVLQKLPGCVVHTFDCTLKDNNPRKKPSSGNVRFYPYCIGGKDAQLPYLSYEKIWEATQSSTPPKLLKMDVEGFEYDVMNNLLSSNRSIWPEQIMVCLCVRVLRACVAIFLINHFLCRWKCTGQQEWLMSHGCHAHVRLPRFHCSLAVYSIVGDTLFPSQIFLGVNLVMRCC